MYSKKISLLIVLGAILCIVEITAAQEKPNANPPEAKIADKDKDLEKAIRVWLESKFKAADTEKITIVLQSFKTAPARNFDPNNYDDAQLNCDKSKPIYPVRVKYTVTTTSKFFVDEMKQEREVNIYTDRFGDKQVMVRATGPGMMKDELKRKQRE
jgi:hypothetical protein